jgi:hypothetical protein
VTQNRVERLPIQRLVRPLPCPVYEPHTTANLLDLQREPPPGFSEHLRGGVEDRDLVALLGERYRLLPRATTDVNYAGRRPGEVFGEPAVDELVANDLAQNTARGVVALGEVGEGIFQPRIYFPFFKYFSKSLQGRQLITLSFSTHARRACETPYFM